MLQPPPARPGMREDEIDTPALVLDLEMLDRNIAEMAAFAKIGRASCRERV